MFFDYTLHEVQNVAITLGTQKNLSWCSKNDLSIIIVCSFYINLIVHYICSGWGSCLKHKT